MKKKILYKLLSGILSASLSLVSVVTVPGMNTVAYAAEASEGLSVTAEVSEVGSFWYTVPGTSKILIFDKNDDGGLIFKTGRNMDGYIDVPAYVNGYPVTQIGRTNANAYGENIFNGFNLTGIKIPETVKILGEFLFLRQENLKEVVLPDSVVSLEKGVFNSSGVQKVVLSTSMTEIPAITFAHCDHLKEVVIPDSITEIGVTAFWGCKSLESITLPKSLKKIGRDAFWECSSLKSIEIPEGVTRIEATTFAGCSSLKSITIPSSVTYISSTAFGTQKSTMCVAPVEEINYNGTPDQYKKIKISGEAKTISNSGTISCSDGTKIVNGEEKAPEQKPDDKKDGNNDLSTNTVTKNKIKYKISGSTATVTGPSNKSTVTSAVIPNTIQSGGKTYRVTAIASNAFKNAKKMTSVKIGSNVTKIGSAAFQGCVKLKKVTGFSRVTTIGSKAFYGCTMLASVAGGTKVTSVGSKAFYNCKKLTKIGSKSNTITLAKVKTISSSAFYYCKSIRKVNLSSTALTKVGASAFQGCTAMTSFISKSAKLSSIGKKAFYGDKKLASVTLKTAKLTSSKIGSAAFKGIKSTCKFSVPASKVSSYKKILKAKGAGSKFVVKKL